VPVLIVNNHYK